MFDQALYCSYTSMSSLINLIKTCLGFPHISVVKISAQSRNASLMPLEVPKGVAVFELKIDYPKVVDILKEC